MFNKDEIEKLKIENESLRNQDVSAIKRTIST